MKEKRLILEFGNPVIGKFHIARLCSSFVPSIYCPCVRCGWYAAGKTDRTEHFYLSIQTFYKRIDSNDVFGAG